MFAEFAAVLTVGSVDLDNIHASSAQEAGESHAEAAAALDADAVQGAEPLGPSQQRRVAGLRRRHHLATQAPAEPVEGNRNVHVGVRVDPQDDERLGLVGDGQEVHRALLSLKGPASACASRETTDKTATGPGVRAPMRSRSAPTGGAAAPAWLADGSVERHGALFFSGQTNKEGRREHHGRNTRNLFFGSNPCA